MRTKIVLRAADSDYLLHTLDKNLADKKCKIKKFTGGAECVFDETENIRGAIVKTVREYIVDNCEEREISKILNREYKCLSSDERKNLKSSIKKAIDVQEDIRQQLFVMKRNRIIDMMTNKYFDENRELNVEGLIPFRLKNYSYELQYLVDYSADEYVMKKEYEEFIYLLKEYLKLKPHKMRVINIVATNYGRYEYYSENGTEITLSLKRKCLENSEEYCSEEDILTGILINLNPGKIVIHKKQNMQREILGTISKIFENSCVFCKECSICKSKIMQ